MSEFPCKATRYGFDWGPMKIERFASDPKFGVVVAIGSESKQFLIRVSPKGQSVTVTEQAFVHWSEGDE